MIPDAPLPPWVLAYAEYDGAVVLADTFQPGWERVMPKRYIVCRPAILPLSVGRMVWYGPSASYHDDETEARAVFEREAERLRA